MQSKTVRRILGNITSPTAVEKLASINMFSDGNHVYDSESELLSIDYEHELIKIKKYSAKGISAILKNPVISGTTLTFDNYIKSGKYPFRNAKVGDIIFFVSKSTSETLNQTAKIVSIEGNKITLNKEVSVSDAYVCYADGEKYATSVILLNDNKLLGDISYSSNFTADIYISFDGIASISFL